MIEVSSASDIGRVRTSNEDSYGVFSPAVYVVADGLGGHAAGEVASRMVVAAVHDMANEGGALDTASLQSALLRANAQVLSAAAGNSLYEGMGSTATVLHIDESAGMAYYAHVGDSRLYLLRRGVFRQVSRDHSYVEELVSRGELSEAEAQHHPRKNLLLRAVGIEERLHVDGDSFSLENGDRLLLATDGLTNMVSDEDLSVLLGDNRFAGVADRMVERALAEGGKDNRNFTNEITPYLGVTYDIGANHTLYASYTSIFKPQTAKDANDKYLDPIQGKDYEVGIKGEYLDGALQASLGVFKIVQDKLGINTGKINPATNADIFEAGKGVTSKGVELDINGEITKNLSLSFGATHFNAKDANGEKYATDSSRSTANLFAKYEIRDFRVGAGAMYKSKIYTGKDANEITQKGYTLANLMFGYKFAKNFDVQLNIDNLFNKKYYEGIGKNKMVYGDRRNIPVTIKVLNILNRPLRTVKPIHVPIHRIPRNIAQRDLSARSPHRVVELSAK